jgi:anti-sigma regulatory factor (Ser/Thr protein kinase)
MTEAIAKRWELMRGDHASRVARQHIQRVLAPVARPAIVEDAALLTSELVSNVMRHTTGPCVLTLRFDHRDECVEIGVTDWAPELHLRLGRRLPHTVGGFGLNVVDQLASRWGSTLHTDSKTVWFQLA